MLERCWPGGGFGRRRSSSPRRPRRLRSRRAKRLPRNSAAPGAATASDGTGRSRASVPEALGRTSARSPLQSASRLLRARRPADRRRGVRGRAGVARERRRPPLHVHRVGRRVDQPRDGSVSWPCRFPTRCPARQRSLLCRRVGVAIGTRRERVLGAGQRQPGRRPDGVPGRADRRGRHVRRAADAVAERGDGGVAAGAARSRLRDRHAVDHGRVRRVDGAGPDQAAAVLQVGRRRRSRLPRLDAADPDRPSGSIACRSPARRAADATR